MCIKRSFVLAALAVVMLPASGVYAKKKGGRRPSPSVKVSPKPDASSEERRQSGTATGDSGDGDERGSGARDDEGVEAEAPRPKPRRRSTVRATPEDGEEADVAATAGAAESSDEPGTGSRWLELALGGRGFTRDLRYHQQVTPGLRQHQLPLGPALVLDLALYPLALLTRLPAANIGLVAGFEQAVGIMSELSPDSTFPNGARFPTSMHEITGGLRYRIPLGASQIGASISAGQHAFWMVSGDGADRNQLEIPNVVYRFVRASLDARIAVTPDFYLGAGAGYRHVVNSAGDFVGFFPHLTVAGVDADVGGGYRITPNIEARVQGGIRRYFYDMRSVRGDTHLAGGAIDQYLSVAALLAVTLDANP
jgi:hypothetical protein